MTFLPDGYKQPDTSKYMKFKEGENRFRVMSPAIIGFEYWTTENKPIRSSESFKETPGIKTDKEGRKKVNHFWAFIVWDYKKEAIGILQITQKGIQYSIMALVENKDWGDPKEYDIVVTRKGEGLETEYNVMPCPKKQVDEIADATMLETPIKLESLYTGDDPFSPELSVAPSIEIPSVEAQEFEELKKQKKEAQEFEDSLKNTPVE